MLKQIMDLRKKAFWFKRRWPRFCFLTVNTIIVCCFLSCKTWSLAATGGRLTTQFSENNEVVWKLIGPGDADQVTAINISRSGIVYVSTDIGGVYHSKDWGESWSAVNRGIRNYDIITPVLIDPDDENVLYIGTRGGFYKSVDGGMNWQAKWDGLGRPHPYSLSARIATVAMAPDKTLYLGLGYRSNRDGFLYKSTDRGESWKQLTSLGTDVKIRSIVADPSNARLVYATTNKGLFVSPDGGKSWEKRFSGAANMIVIHPTQGNILYLSCGKDGVYKSVDGAKNWVKTSNGLGFYQGRFPDNYSLIVLDHQFPEVIYVANRSWGLGGGIYKSADAGENWERITKWRGWTKWKGWNLAPGNMEASWLDESQRVNAIAVDPRNPDRIFAGTSRYIYKTKNGGETWQQLISKKSPTVEGGWTHRGINVFGHTRVVAVDPLAPENIYIGTADHGLVKSVDGGNSWQLSVKGMKYADSIFDVAISKSTPGTLYAINLRLLKFATVSKSTDWGQNWKSAAAGLPKDTIFHSLLLSCDNENILYLGGRSGVYKTADGGNSWFAQNEGLSEAGSVHKLAQSPTQPETILAATQRGVYKTTDGGKLWRRTYTSRDPENVFSLVLDPTRPETVYLACIAGRGSHPRWASLGGVFKSLDGGETWERILAARRIGSIALMPDNPQVIYAASQDHNYHDESTGEGVFRSVNGGETWQSVNNGLPVLRSWNISIDQTPPYKVYLSSNGSGAYVSVDPLYAQSNDSASSGR